MRAALYARVSTLEQATEGYSVGVQTEKLTHYAKAQSYEVVDLYKDEGFSGKTLARPGVERLIGDIKLGKIDVVIIYKLDRLSRRVKDILELVELFEKYQVTLYSLSENLDLSSPFGRAALKMSATFSELERETIVERMEMGKTARAKAGLYSCPGANCPFGYRHDKQNDRFAIDEAEAEMIRKIFDLYINHGFTFRKLYDYCREAYPDVRFFSNPMCCKPLIERPMYAGYFRHGDDLIKGKNFDPIISYETFLQAQARVEANRTKRSSDNTPYLLTGLLVCGKCGNRYVGKLYERFGYKKDGSQTKHYRYRTYGCAARVKRDKKYHPVFCDNDIHPAEALEDIVNQRVKGIKFQESEGLGFVPGLVENLMSEISALKDKQEKLLDLYLDNTIDKDTYLMRLVEVESKINENKAVIEAEKDKIQAVPANSTEILNEKLAHYDDLSKKEKGLLLRFLIKNIVINGDDITINYRFR